MKFDIYSSYCFSCAIMLTALSTFIENSVIQKIIIFLSVNRILVGIFLTFSQPKKHVDSVDSSRKLPTIKPRNLINEFKKASNLDTSISCEEHKKPIEPNSNSSTSRHTRSHSS